jgi:hypothetical protein
LKAVPLSAYGKPYTPPKGNVDPKQDMSAPPDQVDRRSGEAFFSLFAELMPQNPPHPNDDPIPDRIRRIGPEPGRSLSLTSQTKEAQEAMTAAPAVALPAIKAVWRNAGVAANGWKTNLMAIGAYGADYLHRAAVAFDVLAANVADDAVYPTAFADAEGQPFNSARRYRVRLRRTRPRPPGPFGRSQCTTTASSLPKIRSIAMRSAIVTTSNTIRTARLTSISSGCRRERTKKRIGCRLRRAADSP